MPTVIRQDANETFERSSLPSRATIRYLVQGSSAYKANDACLAVQDPANFTDPNDAVPLGTAHPDGIFGDRLTATRYRAVQRAGAGNERSWFVDVEFSLDGSGANFEEPPITEPNYQTIEISTIDKDFKGPYWIRQPIVGVSPAGALSTTYKWEERFIDFRVSALQLRVVTNVTTDPNQSQNPYLLSSWVQNNNQVNKIHNIPINGTFQWAVHRGRIRLRCLSTLGGSRINGGQIRVTARSRCRTVSTSPTR